MLVDPSGNILEQDACKPLYHLFVICLWFSFYTVALGELWSKTLNFSLKNLGRIQDLEFLPQKSWKNTGQSIQEWTK